MSSLLAALLGVACTDVETALTIEGVLHGGATCSFDSNSTKFLLDIQINVADSKTLWLPLKVENTLLDGDLTLDDKGKKEIITFSNAVLPLRFDLRWECDANGFSTNLGPMYLPGFSVEDPICFDSRDDGASDLSTFDVIPAAGPAIQAREKSIVEIRPITAQLGNAIDDMFNLATAANACCNDPQMNGCETVAATEPDSLKNVSAECKTLVELFNDVGEGKLTTTEVADIEKFQPFAIYDQGAAGTRQEPKYQMRMRGILEGVTPDGDLVTSQEYAQDIGICRGCPIGKDYRDCYYR